MMFGTTGFAKNINVIVGGNAAGYNRAMMSAGAATAKFTKAVAVMGAAVVVASVVLLTKAVSAASEFEQAMADVKAVTQPTAKQFELLSDKAKQLGRDTKFTMVDIAAGMEALGRAGFSTEEILSGVDGAASLAAAASISLGEAADITSKTIRAMGLEASDAGRVADVFAQAAASANVDVSMLGESMKYIAPLARAAGFSLEETVAAIAKLGDAGIQGSQAGTALRYAFAELIAETDGFVESLANVGVTMADISDPNGELMGFIDIMNILEEAGADTGDILDMMGKRAGPAIAALVQENDGLGELATLLKNAAGAAQEMADTRMDTLSGQMTILAGSWNAMLVTIGDKIIPIIQDLVENAIIPAVNEFNVWAEESDALEEGLSSLFETIKKGVEWFIKNYGKVVIGLKAILAVTGLLVAAKIITAFKTLTLAIKGLGVALGPVGIAAVAAYTSFKILKGILTPLAEAASMNVERVGDMVGSFEDLADSANRAAEVSEILTMAINMAGSELDKLFDMDIGTLSRIAGELDELRIEIVASGDSASDMADAWSDGVTSILGSFQDLVPGIATVLDKIVAQSKTAARDVANAWDMTPGVNPFELFGAPPQHGPREGTGTGTAPAPADVPDPAGSWQTKIADWLAEGWSEAIDAVIGMLPEKVAAFASGMFGALQTFLVNPIAGAIQGIAVIFTALNDMATAARQKILDTFTWLKDRIVDMWSVIENAATKLADSFNDLITSTENYQAMQKAASDLQSMIFNLLLGFLKPVFSLIQSIFGITAAVITAIDKSKLTEVGVPRSWKRAARAYEAASPGAIWPGDEPLEDELDDTLTWVDHLITRFGVQIENMIQLFKNAAEILESVWAAVGEPIMAAVLDSLEWLGEGLVALASYIDSDMKTLLKNTLPKILKGGLDLFLGYILGVARFIVDTFEATAVNLAAFSVNLGTIGRKLPEFFAALSNAISPVINTLLEGALIPLSEFIITDLMPSFQKFFAGFGEWWTTEMEPFLKGKAFPLLGEILSSLWEQLKSIVDILAPYIVPLLEGVLEVLASVWTTVEPVLIRLINFIDTHWDTIERILLTRLEAALTDLVTNLEDAVGFLERNAWLADLGGGGSGMGLLPFAEGGVVPGPIGQPRMSLTHGQEIILNQTQQAGVLAGLNGGGGTTEVHVYVGGREVSDYTVRSIQRRGKRLTGKKSTSAGLREAR